MTALRPRIAAAAGCLALTACSAPPAEWPVHDDLIARGALHRDGEPAASEDCLCRDETWTGVIMAGGETLEAELGWHAGSHLVVSGCLDCPTRDTGGARIGWRLAGPENASEGTIEIEPGSGWWQRELRLPSATAKGFLQLHAEIPEGCLLSLREVLVRRTGIEPRRRGSPPQVLLISVDTLRADVLGPDSAPTPVLDALAAEGELWSRHYSGSYWTLPSHATMLTGYPTWVHGAADKRTVIDHRVPTLAERFSESGFDTAALVYSAGWLNAGFGFDRGFDSYRVEPWRIDRQVREAASWIHDHQDRPFFFFFHTFEPHSDFEILPYEAPEVHRGTIEELFGVPGYGCRRGTCASQLLTRLGRGTIARHGYDGPVLRYLYRQGVRHTDAALGELFDGLRRAGIWNDLLVALTSDHGEEFFEHDGTLHETLHEEIIRVPLIVKWPGGERAGLRHESVTSAIDLAPTLLEFAGIEGQDLPGVHLHHIKPDRVAFSGDYPKAVIDGHHKGIFGGEERLGMVFDLALDPGEEDDLSSRRPELARRLQEAIRQQVIADRRRFGVHEPRAPDGGEDPLGPDDLIRLRALGYLE